jgi:hypothetical protein
MFCPIMVARLRLASNKDEAAMLGNTREQVNVTRG